MSARTGRVGVVGAYGAVGRIAVAQLRAWDVGPLRVGGRDRRRTEELAAGMAAEPCPVDVTDPVNLDGFCAGCAVVLNCAGPTLAVGDLVARAAARAGAHYVDVSGDDGLYATVSAAFAASDRAAAVSAGMMPGLTTLLPRYLAATSPVGPTRLVGYVGGRDRFTTVAAADYLAVDGSAAQRYGEPFAAWLDGGRVPHGLAPLIDTWLPFFPEPATAQPYLSTETERLAADLGLTEVRWYSVFPGEHTLAALRARRPDATALREAAALDTFGRDRYMVLVLEISGQDTVRTGVLRGTGATELTGAMGALATRQVWAGRVPAGTHHAGEILDPADTALLGEALAVDQLAVYDGTPADRFNGYDEDTL
ncbi:MAG: saccharopine dehydrogenase NADP-binding domain-containing protein [Micromonosporaceae bacterium]